MQVVLGLGVAAAGVYGLHQLLAPRVSAWSQHLFSSRKAAAEAEAERTAALTAALERLSEGQARLQETLEGLTAAVRQQPQRGFADSQADYLACHSPSLGAQGGQRSQQQQQHGGGFGSSYYGRDGGQTTDTYASSSRAAAVRGGSSWDPYAPDASYRPASDGRPGSAASPSGRVTATGGGPSGYYGSSATGFEVTPPPMGTYRAPQPPAQYGGSSSATNPAGPSGVDPGYARRTGAYAGPEESSAAGAPVYEGPFCSSICSELQRPDLLLQALQPLGPGILQSCACMSLPSYCQQMGQLCSHGRRVPFNPVACWVSVCAAASATTRPEEAPRSAAFHEVRCRCSATAGALRRLHHAWPCGTQHCNPVVDKILAQRCVVMRCKRCPS